MISSEQVGVWKEVVMSC